MDLFTQNSIEPDIILLDYQCTLCRNGNGRFQWLKEHPKESYRNWIRQEEMREFLLPLIRDKYVILITARRTWWEKPTLERIGEVLHWQPQEWYFNPDPVSPPEHKRRVMESCIFPSHGNAESGRYLALESNANTRRMYHSLGIPAFRIDQEITELPR